MTKPPSKPNSGDESGPQSPHYNVNIQGGLHLTSNDIAELRKLADSHPDLAKQLATDRHSEAVLRQNTERLGMVLAVVFGVALIGGTSLTLVQLGWWQSIMFVGALLGISHILRTILKGEFSETSWFGAILRNTPKSKNTQGENEPS